MIEEWKPAPGFEGWYEVSSLGRVRRSRPARNSVVGRIMKLQTHKDGYVFADLCKNGRQCQISVSRLVCAAFNGPCPNGKNCNHKDGIKANNSITNLEWVTHSENCKHKFRVLGYTNDHLKLANPFTGKKGSAHPFAKRYVVTDPSGTETVIIGLKDFCRKNNLHFGAMVQIATGSGHSYYHKGWKCRKY